MLQSFVSTIFNANWRPFFSPPLSLFTAFWNLYILLSLSSLVLYSTRCFYIYIYLLFLSSINLVWYMINKLHGRMLQVIDDKICKHFIILWDFWENNVSNNRPNYLGFSLYLRILQLCSKYSTSKKKDVNLATEHTYIGLDFLNGGHSVDEDSRE